MVDYKGKIGIYKAKSQAKYLGEPAVEYHQQRLKTGDFEGISQGGKMKGPNFARCLNPPCEISQGGFFMVRNGQIFWQVNCLPLRNGVAIACAHVST